MSDQYPESGTSEHLGLSVIAMPVNVAENFLTIDKAINDLQNSTPVGDSVDAGTF